MNNNTMQHLVIDNFFEQFKFIEFEFKRIQRFDKDMFNLIFKENQNWPGSRSEFLLNKQPFLFNLFLKEFKKFNFDLSFYDVSLYTHLRLAKDNVKDWIHSDDDSGEYTCLVYLSETNLDSGTYFYSKDKKIVSDIKFVQNRAILFDSRYLHSAYGHYGSDVNDGRLTLNCFLKKVRTFSSVV